VNPFGIGIMEIIAPFQKYEIDIQNWYIHKPKYPGPSPEQDFTFLYRLKQAWRVLRGKAIAISI